MVAYCPNMVAGVKTVAFGNGAGAGMGYGAGCGMGMHSMAGCCGSVLGVGLFPLAMVAAVGFLGYKVYVISKKDNTASAVTAV